MMLDFNATIERARREQAEINMRAKEPPLSDAAYDAQFDALREELAGAAYSGDVGEIARSLDLLAPRLRDFLETTAPRYLRSKGLDRSVLEVATEEVYEAFREAARLLVFEVSENNLQVHVGTQRDELETLRQALRTLSRVLLLEGEDKIQLQIDMDCSRDADLARQLQDML